ncbi:MAG: sigma-70 family RNA polymerase sigma factor [Planctomycetes bacterium]|nr:sigma-70 family RNA polymerase sigma factor [Planctomycetota bacterium]
MAPFSSPEHLLAHDAFVRALAHALVRDPDRADDLAQQTWLRALRAGMAAIDSAPAADGLRAWFATVARRLAVDRNREDTRRSRREQDASRAEAVPSPDELLAREAARAAVVDAVLALEPIYRDVVVLRWFEGLPPRAIARRLGVGIETIRTRQKRALAQLRARLDGNFGTRSAWVATLTPLAAVQDATLLSIGTGGIAMQAKLVVGAIAVVVVASIAAWIGADPDPPAEPTEVAQNTVANSAPTVGTIVGDPSATEVDPEPTRHETVVVAPAVTDADDSADPSRPRATLRGVVRDLAGAPVPFVEVAAISGDLPSWDAIEVVFTRADGYGRFEFERAALPAWIAARDETRRITTTEAPRVLATAARSSTDVDGLIVRVEAARVLVVRVLDADEAPIAGAHVIVSRTNDATAERASDRVDVNVSIPPFQRRATAGDGSVEFPLAPTGRLVASANVAGGTYGVEIADADAREVVVRLPKASGITVRVTDVAGRPIPGAEWLAPGIADAWQSTDAHGRSAVGNVQPSILAAPIVRARGYAVTLGPSIDTRPGATTTVVLERERRIDGRVVGLRGEPRDGVRVTVRGDRSDSPWRGRVRTLEQRAKLDETLARADGSFSFEGLYRGTFAVEAWVDDEGTPAAFAVAGPDDTEVELRVGSRHPLEVVLTGTVVDARTRAPIATSRVSALAVDDRFANAARSVSAQGGAFELRALRAGPYRLAVSAAGYAPCVTEVAEFGAGEHRVDLALEPVSSLRLRVVDRGDRPVQGAWIALVDRSGRPLFGRGQFGAHTNSTVTDADGVASFDRVRAVAARVHVEHANLVEPLDLDVPPPDASGTATVSLPVELAEARRTLTIDVRDAAGAPFDGMFAIDVVDTSGATRLAWSGATFDDLSPRFAPYSSLESTPSGEIAAANTLFANSLRAVERSGEARHVVTLRVPRSSTLVRVTRAGTASTASATVVPADEPVTAEVRLPEP